jgi:hypothetical protein
VVAAAAGAAAGGGVAAGAGVLAGAAAVAGGFAAGDAGAADFGAHATTIIVAASDTQASDLINESPFGTKINKDASSLRRTFIQTLEHLLHPFDLG